MWLLAFFTQDGMPETGLSPLIKVINVETDAVIVNNAAMSETGDGFYKYDFSAYDPEIDYAIICDSVTLSGVGRYTYASSGEYNKVLNSIESTVGLIDIRTILIRKIQTNALRLSDGNVGNWELMDDDGTSVLLTFDISDKDGNLIVQSPNVPSRRSKVY